MNLGCDREVTAVSRSVTVTLRMLFSSEETDSCCSNKFALLWMSCLSQFVGNICAADLIILLVKNIYKY